MTTMSFYKSVDVSTRDIVSELQSDNYALCEMLSGLQNMGDDDLEDFATHLHEHGDEHAADAITFIERLYEATFAKKED